MIDFESTYLYRKHLPQGQYRLQKNNHVYMPTLNVPYGLFYTLRKTASTFRVQYFDGSYVSDLGNVADIIGVNIYIEPGSVVELMVNGQSCTVKAPGEIYFKNHCHSNVNGTSACLYEPHNLSNKTKRNDFYLNSQAFALGGMTEYEMFLVDSYEPTEPPDVVCEAAHFESSRGSDEAPCAASGYGGGGGLPPSP